MPVGLTSGRNLREAEREEELSELRRQVSQLASHWPTVLGGGATRQWVVIGGDSGNQTLVSGQRGIKYQTSNVIEVSTAYDPTTKPDTSADDGIGWGDLFQANVVGSSKVLVVMDPRCAFRFDALGYDSYSVLGTVSIAVTGGGSVTCYLLASP